VKERVLPSLFLPLVLDLLEHNDEATTQTRKCKQRNKKEEEMKLGCFQGGMEARSSRGGEENARAKKKNRRERKGGEVAPRCVGEKERRRKKKPKRRREGESKFSTQE
jgi:hypothetical protein